MREGIFKMGGTPVFLHRRICRWLLFALVALDMNIMDYPQIILPLAAAGGVLAACVVICMLGP
jgi:hypothetical protein